MHRLGSLKLFTLAFMIAITTLVYFLIPKLPLSLYPNSSKPAIRVQINHELDTLDFKNNVGTKMEQAIRNVDGVEQIDGNYSPGYTEYSIKFGWGHSSLKAYQDISSVTAFYQSLLPENTPPINTSYYDPGLELYVAVNPEHHDPEKLSKLLQQRLEPALKNIAGISSVYISPVNDKEIAIKINPYRLSTLNLTMDNILTPIQNARFDYSLGTIQGSSSSPEFKVVYVNSNKTIEDIGQIPVTIDSGRLITLSDIADITLRTKPQDRVFNINGERVIAIAAWPLPEADLYNLAKAFEAKVAEELADIADIKTINSPIRYIDESIQQMLQAVAAGMLFAGLSVLVAFRSLRMSGVIIMAMPLSIVVAVAFLYLLGVGINIVSIGAVGIAIGMVIDAAVFVVDRIRSKFDKAKTYTQSQVLEHVVQGVKESVAPVISTTLTSVVVFLPLAFTQPVVKALIGDFVIVIILLLLASLFISLIVVPTLLLTLSGITRNTRWLGINPQKGRPVFRWLLKQLLSRVWLWLPFTLATAWLMWFSTHLLVNDVRRDIIAQPLPNIIDVGFFFTSTDLPYAARQEIVQPVQAMIQRDFHDDIKFVFADIRQQVAWVSIHIKDYNKVDYFISELKKRVKNTDQYSTDISPWVSASVKVEKLPHVRVLISGDSHQKAMANLNRVYQHLAATDGVNRTNAFPRINDTSFAAVALNNERIAAIASDADFNGIRQSITQTSRYAAKPEFQYDIELDSGQVPLVVQLGDYRAGNAEHIENLPMYINGGIYNLGQLATITTNNKNSNYFTRNSSNMYIIELMLADHIQDRTGFVKQTLAKLDNFDVNSVSISTSDREIDENTKSLQMALLAALVLVLLILLFDLVSLPFVLITFVSIPVGLIGATYALYEYNSTLSVNSLIGLIMLAGLGVNNAIFIIHAWRKLNSETTMNPLQTILSAVESRLNAILITSISTIFAMQPLATGAGNGGPIIQPLGLTMVGGMISMTLFSITLTPVLLYRYDLIRRRVNAWLKRTNDPSALPSS